MSSVLFGRLVGVLVLPPSGVPAFPGACLADEAGGSENSQAAAAIALADAAGQFRANLATGFCVKGG